MIPISAMSFQTAVGPAPHVVMLVQAGALGLLVIGIAVASLVGMLLSRDDGSPEPAAADGVSSVDEESEAA
jgi:hypothetical protein